MDKEIEESLEKALIDELGWTKKLGCWLDSNRKVVAYHPFRPEAYLPDTHVLLEAIRGSGLFCCIKINSDYNYIWEMSLTPSGYTPGKGFDLSEDKHEPTIFSQAETFQELIVKCLFAMRDYNARQIKS